jgi:hypothetical protein
MEFQDNVITSKLTTNTQNPSSVKEILGQVNEVSSPIHDSLVTGITQLVRA